MLSKDKLHLLTLNTHSLMEPDTEFCLEQLTLCVHELGVDLVSLQEVNQPLNARLLSEKELQESQYVPSGDGFPIREGNFAYLLARKLQTVDPTFHWTWAYAHRGYDRFDEGLAIFARGDFSAVKTIAISNDGARCPRTILSASLDETWFSAVHMGWWNDPEDPFQAQWERTDAWCRKLGTAHYLLGDFNNPAHLSNEGYDTVKSSGWRDCYLEAQRRDDGVTVGESIDGWRKNKVDPMRIDFVFRSFDSMTLESRVVFNGDFYPVISDHYGVYTVEKRSD